MSDKKELTENEIAELAHIGSQHLYIGAMDEGHLSYGGVLEIIKRYEEINQAKQAESAKTAHTTELVSDEELERQMVMSNMTLAEFVNQRHSEAMARYEAMLELTSQSVEDGE